MSIAIDYGLVARLGVAALAGLAVGVERERSGHAVGPNARFAGVRTFLLLGILGGFAGWLASTSLGLAALATASVFGLWIGAAAYVARVRPAVSIERTTSAHAPGRQQMPHTTSREVR